MPVEVGHQVGKPAAFGVHRAAGGEFADLVAQCDVAGKFFAVLLGESARQHQCRGALRKRVGDRIEGHHLRTGRVKEFVVLGVAEGEGLTGGNRHPRAARDRFPRRTLWRPHRTRHLRSGQCDDRVQIDVPGDELGHRCHRVTRRIPVFGGGHQPEMT